MPKADSQQTVAELRARAEALLRRQRSRDSQHPENLERVVEELRVHQIELELQNDELSRAQASLQRSNDELNLLFELAPSVYLTLDRGLRVQGLNRRARENLVQEPGASITKLVAIESRPGLVNRLREALTGKGEVHLEVWFTPPGRPRWLADVSVSIMPHSSSGPVLLLSARDITAEREAQQALAKNRSELQQLLRLAPDAIAIFDHGRFLFGNDAWAALLGRETADLDTIPLYDVIDPRDHHVLENLLTVGRGSAATTAELRLVPDRNESARVAEVRRMELQWAGRACVLLMARDLTERRRLDAQMAQAERMATVGMLVAGVAHEVNNPLTFVMLALDDLQPALDSTEAWEGKARMRRRVGEIREGCERVASIVADLRDFYRVDDAQRRTAPNDVIARTLRMAGPKLAHRVNLDSRLGVVPKIVCNEGRLSQVLVNLLVNASEAMPPERPVQDNRVEVRSWSTGSEVCIAIEDNGMGIAEENLKHLFDPFFTTRGTEGGTGLGLAISNSLMQQMGGWIEVDSRPGSGTRFVLHLADEEQPERRPTQIPAASTIPPRKLRILVIDDEREVARALSRSLRSIGAVEIEASGNAAIERLERDRAFDVILCDLVMPNGSGPDVARWLHASAPGLFKRLIFMSGMGHVRDEISQSVPQVHKPFDMAVLRDVLGRVAASAPSSEDAPSGEKTA